MMLVMFFDVIGRYVFNRPIIGSIEIISCFMGLLVFAGMGVTTLRDGHIKVDLVTQMASLKWQRLMAVFVHVLSALIAGVITWRLAAQAVQNTADGSVTQVLTLPLWLVVWIMAAFSLMLVLGLLVHLQRHLRTNVTKVGDAHGR
ncbi:TRAP transporter small permease [Cognatishimia sp. SS12]|uniref:TRAP transporter small permease n=1 Tax=Cognatishimia sp. SS12 TaxID=2979465 RepID=UPI00232BD315|nr:TRAP transporter small permease [Cognatishimia sp. SS12]MDC0739559.1 TRAP transporter small permease [Cognatishimia sp. SS12]